MIYPLPSFGWREYAINREEGHLCPSCRVSRLVRVGEANELRCAGCGSLYNGGWLRHHYAKSPPSSISGSPVSTSGGFFATIQSYPLDPSTLDEHSLNPLLELRAADREPSERLEIGHLADLVLDIDRDDPLEALAECGTLVDYFERVAPNQARYYWSGAKGAHVIIPWQTLGAVPHVQLATDIYRRVAGALHRETGVKPDYKIYSPGRMLRMPDSWHPKTGLYKVEFRPEELPDARELAKAPRGILNTEPWALSLTLHELFQEAQDAAKRARSEPSIITAQPAFGPMGLTPPCITGLLTYGLPSSGTRHAAYWVLAAFWRNRGLDERAASQAGRDYARDHGEHSSSPVYVRAQDMAEVVRYVYRNNVPFRCRQAQALGTCGDECPMKRSGSLAGAPLLGMIL